MSIEQKSSNKVPKRKKLNTIFSSVGGQTISGSLGEGYGTDYTRGIRVPGEGVLNEISAHVPHILIDCFPPGSTGKEIVGHVGIPLACIIVYQIAKNTKNAIKSRRRTDIL